MKFHKLDTKQAFEYLQTLAKDADFPVIHIDEYTNMDYHSNDTHVPDYSGNYVFDTKTLLTEDEDILSRMQFEFQYVGEIIESALLGYKSAMASLKYSFGDTVNSNDYKPVDETDRKVITIDVDVHK